MLSLVLSSSQRFSLKLMYFLSEAMSRYMCMAKVGALPEGGDALLCEPWFGGGH